MYFVTGEDRRGHPRRPNTPNAIMRHYRWCSAFLVFALAA